MIEIIHPEVKTYFVTFAGGTVAGCGSVYPETVMQSGADSMETYTDRAAYISRLTELVGPEPVAAFLRGAPTPNPPPSP
jgi:hypothetical protein